MNDARAKSRHAAQARGLEALARRNRLRQLSPRAGLDFASNDYLGLASAPELREAAMVALEQGASIGSGGSRLLRGNDAEHEALEAEAATFFGAEAALFFGGGFVANYALFSTLPQREDLIVHDELIHASVHDGMKASRAPHVAVPHNDVQAFGDAIAKWRSQGHTGRAWIAVESLYSMDGDIAPLEDLMSVARRHDAILVADEAHATGVFGPQGRGLSARFEATENFIALHTCGKALGVMGGIITAPKVLCDFIVNRGRPFIYATAPSPLLAAVVRASLRLIAQGDERRAQLSHLVRRVGRALEEKCGIQPTGTQIQPVIVGSDAEAVRLAAAMQARGYDIRAIRPPTVPEGTARLRLSLNLNVSEDEALAMVDDLAEEQAQRLAS
ncbi:8-amino-7-oxononanoate synthase [Filomicrobium insigne]|uniref:8-amino-7-oxononanoate synthase n=1 Tax=Filomicrobium insigne TaxID=418854 RepID=A0A1H0TPT7_9HYPH|nr:8-amino-7-oxononanoate synthase [Filomicrobium insigne]SDP55785.1 8-amino-7-oxononanoate synthase [Filomicrobium insigne]